MYFLGNAKAADPNSYRVSRLRLLRTVEVTPF